MLWAKMVGSTLALARGLLDRGDWDGVRRWPASWPTPGKTARPRN